MTFTAVSENTVPSESLDARAGDEVGSWPKITACASAATKTVLTTNRVAMVTKYGGSRYALRPLPHVIRSIGVFAAVDGADLVPAFQIRATSADSVAHPASSSAIGCGSRRAANGPSFGLLRLAYRVEGIELFLRTRQNLRRLEFESSDQSQDVRRTNPSGD